jgi:CRISPR/Cas system-associated protein endoribonuclease Cas2
VYYFLKKQQMEADPLVMRPHWQKKIDDFVDEWGTIDEVEIEPKGFAHLQVMLGQLETNEQVELLSSFKGKL